MKRPAKTRLLYGIAIGFTLLLGACSEAIQVDDTDKQFPVLLSATISNDVVTLRWDEAHVSGFESYKLVRSLTPLPPGLNPSSNGTDIRVLLNTDDPDSTSFLDDNVPLVQKAYYKLYIDIGDRLVESDNIAVNFSNFIVDAVPFFAKFHPDSSWVFIADQSSGDLIMVDYLQEKILGRQENLVYTGNLEYASLSFDQFQGAPEAWLWTGFGNKTLISLNPFSVKTTIGGNETGYSLIDNGRGQLLTTSYDYYTSLTVRDYQSFNIIQNHYRSNYYERRMLIMLDPVNERFCEISPYQLRAFNLKASDNWNLSNEQTQYTNTYSVPYLNIPVSKSRQFFMPYTTGEVYNQNLVKIGDLPFISSQEYRGFAFSDDDQFVYSLGIQSFPFATVVQKIRLADLSLVAIRTIDNTFPNAIKAVPGGVVVIGTTNTANNQTFIKKIPL